MAPSGRHTALSPTPPGCHPPHLSHPLQNQRLLPLIPGCTVSTSTDPLRRPSHRCQHLSGVKKSRAAESPDPNGRYRCAAGLLRVRYRSFPAGTPAGALHIPNAQTAWPGGLSRHSHLRWIRPRIRTGRRDTRKVRPRSFGRCRPG